MKPSHWRRSAAGPWLRRLPRLKHLRGTWLHRALGERFFSSELWTPRRERFAAGAAVGMFFAMLPFPLQMAGAACIAFLTRVNIPAAIVCTWISNPVTIPFFLTAQYAVGGFLLGRAGKAPPDPSQGALEFIAGAPVPILAGAGALAVASSLLAYPLALLLWDLAHRTVLAPRPAKTGTGTGPKKI